VFIAASHAFRATILKNQRKKATALQGVAADEVDGDFAAFLK
jgi:hypothetical protein